MLNKLSQSYKSLKDINKDKDLVKEAVENSTEEKRLEIDKKEEYNLKSEKRKGIFIHKKLLKEVKKVGKTKRKESLSTNKI